MTRWTGGYVAVGTVAGNAADTGATSGSPVWVSTDGVSWTPLDPSPFGSDAVVVSVDEVASGLVAITLRGGANECGGETRPNCWTLAGPLTSWTSADGASWKQSAGPGIDLPEECDGCGVDVPIIRSGAAGLLVVVTTTEGQAGALSADGIGWQSLPVVFPEGFSASDVEAGGPGFVAVGSRGDPERAAAATSPDGRTWMGRDVPTPAVDSADGSTVNRLLATPDGMLAVGSDQLTPGRELWWTSPDGSAWTPNFKYPPLGVWTGEGEGTGLMPDGNVLGDGDQIVAYRDDGTVAGWTSANGSSWQALAVTGAAPTAAGSWPLLDLTMLPVGLVLTADDGTAWLGAAGS